VKDKIKIFILVFLLVVTSLSFMGEEYKKNINVLQSMNPLIPFAFTYEYGYPSEWQIELMTGASLDVNNMALGAVDTNSSTPLISSGEVGFKFGLPGDLVLVAGWPWIGGYFSAPENGFFPEFDIAVTVPMSFGMLDSQSFTESVNMSVVLKKSLEPVRFSGGLNLLFSPSFKPADEGEEVIPEVGQTYIGFGLEWFVNPYLKILGEYRYQFSSMLYDNVNGNPYKFVVFPPYPNNIIGVGLEYAFDTENFTMKTSIGYAVNLMPPVEGYSPPFGTQGISIGFTFLFPFPFQ